MRNYSKLSEKILSVLDTHSVKNLKSSYSSISSKYREEDIRSTKVVDSMTLAQSYLSSRMPETTHIVHSVLSRLDSVCGLDIHTVLDVGTGTGATMWALDDICIDRHITAVEYDSSMLATAKAMCDELSQHIEYVECSVLSSKFRALPSADLVIESFMLNELSDTDRVKALESMCAKADKYLVLIEPGTPVSYERMMQLREYLLSHSMYMVLPCPHSNKCGLQGDFCNFTVRVPRSSIHRQVKDGTLSYSDEKYFYMVFSKHPVDKVHTSTILRHPQYRKNCIDIKVCSADTTISTKTITKSDKARYKLAKDYIQGDILE